MEIVDAARHMLVTIYAATGVMFVGAIALAVLTAFIAWQASWKVKAIVLLAVANEIRGVAIAGPIAWKLFHH